MAPAVTVVIVGAVAVVPSEVLKARVLVEGATSHTNGESTPEKTRMTIDHESDALNVHA
jgi:hypothetical protein